MSSYGFNYNVAEVFIVNYEGAIHSSGVPDEYTSVRPSISLKPGVKIASGGDGSAATPYEFLVD